MQLPKELMQMIVEEVAKERTRQEIAQAKERKDWRLRNTELLMKNYRMLRSHCDGIVEDLETVEVNVFDRHELEIESLMAYKAKTAKMLNFVDAQLKVYKTYCYDCGDSVRRRYSVVSRLYVDKSFVGKPKKIIAEGLNIDLSTMYRDETKAFQELSMYIFGFDSIQDLNE